MSRGAPKAPITYEGEYDATRTYLPRQVTHVTTGAVRTGYLSTATTTGDDPATSPTIWLPLGGGGDGEHNGTGADSTVVGTSAVASGSGTAAYGDFAEASALNAIALGTGALANAISAVALGPAQATGAASLAAGKTAKAQGYESVALGFATTATGDDSVAIGANAQVDEAGGIAIGGSAYADAEGGIALGPGARAVGLRGIAIGSSVYNPTADTALIAGSYLEIQERTLQQSYLIVTDDVGQRWQIGVDSSGTLTIALA